MIYKSSIYYLINYEISKNYRPQQAEQIIIIASYQLFKNMTSFKWKDSKEGKFDEKGCQELPEKLSTTL